MGDRVSIQFMNGDDLSPCLFSHWRGKSFVKSAIKYLEQLKKEIGIGHVTPLDRLEVGTVMLDFIRSLVEHEPNTRIDSDLYIEKEMTDGDNSDNGHFRIDVMTLKIRRFRS
jgi:hypothetical protein